MDDGNTNVDDVIVRDGNLGKVGKRSSPEQVRNPLQGHGGLIGIAIISRCVAVLCDEPGKHFAKNGVGVFHADLFV